MKKWKITVVGTIMIGAGLRFLLKKEKGEKA
jgi:plastocyanin domain-containing protein